MAEVANFTTTVPSSAAVVTDNSPVSTIIPNVGEIIPSEIIKVESSPDSGDKSTPNSHHHDSEYDTASDLEDDGDEDEDYENDDEEDGAQAEDEDEDEDDDDDDDNEDEDDDDEDDSVGPEDDDNGENDSENDSETRSLELNAERQRGDGQEQTEFSKKVDEDRSNPQYIPKKGTFYEHDDRTGDEPIIEISQKTEENEINPDGSNKSVTPTMSYSSKPVKKASGGDRWSHDRYDETEQAPKSRSELVSSYGYDIRNEDGPPRAHRRHRYGRGPSKYERKWEDEAAYVKANGTPRRNIRSEDFPELGDKKVLKSRSFREEKGNRYERKDRNERNERIDKNEKIERNEKNDRNEKIDRNDRSERIEKSSGHQNRSNGNFRDRESNRRNGSKSFHSGGGNVSGRLAPMEFRNKNRTNSSVNINNATRNQSKTSNNRNQSEKEHQHLSSNRSFNNSIDDNKLAKISATIIFSNSKGINNVSGNNQVQNKPLTLNSQEQRENKQIKQNNSSPLQAKEKVITTNANSSTQSGHATENQSINQTSNLTARLQQVQNRNDPSHVGSVQMHSLVAQQSQPSNNMVSGVKTAQTQSLNHDHHQTITTSIPPEQSRPKRYSLRQRTQNDPSTLMQAVPPQPMDQLSLQLQQQMQHEAAMAAAHKQQPILLQDQQLLQANLMQLYHQQEKYAQMQAIQVAGLQSQPNVVPPPQLQGPVPPANHPKPQYAAMPPQYQGGNGPPNPAYFTTNNEYTTNVPTIPPQQYSQPPQPAYLQTQQLQPQAVTAIAYNPSANPAMNQPPPNLSVPGATAVPPTPLNYVQPYPSSGPQPGGNSQNFGNFQNFNTVGGTTYFVPQPQPPQRSVTLPQRRPTNAIPILPPSDKQKRAQEKEDELKNFNNANTSTLPNSSQMVNSNTSIDSAENIDHILDNMFVQRPPFQPPSMKTMNLSNNAVDDDPKTAKLPQQSQQILSSSSSNSSLMTTSANDASITGPSSVDSATNTLASNVVGETEQIDESLKMLSISQEQLTNPINKDENSASITSDQLLLTPTQENKGYQNKDDQAAETPTNSTATQLVESLTVSTSTNDVD